MLNLRFLSLAALRNLSLRTKLVFAALMVSLIPLTIVSYISYNATRQALVDAANESLAGAADQTADNLDGFIQANLDAVRTQAQLPAFHEYLEMSPPQRQANNVDVGDILRALSRRDPLYILSYALLDQNGIDLIDTGVFKAGIDKSQYDYFQMPFSTGLPYASPVKFSETADLPSIYFSAPVRNLQGKVIGLLRIRYNANIVQQIVANTSGLAGNKSFAILLDENHMRLADAERPDFIFKTVAPLDPAKIAMLQAAGRLPYRPADQLFTNLPGFEQGLATAMTQPLFEAETEPFDSTLDAIAVGNMTTEPWLVVFTKQKTVFLAPVEAQTRNTLFIGLIMSVLVIVFVAYGALLFTRPITNLISVAEKIGAGDLSAQAHVEANDEIGKLAKTLIPWYCSCGTL